MILWKVPVQTLRPLASLPRLSHVAAEHRFDASYRHEGKYRQSETHCIFKYTLEGEGRFRDASGEYRVPAEHGFLCELRDPETAYYYPTDALETWEFVYVCLEGSMIVEFVREMTARHGPIYRLPRHSECVEKLLAFQHYDGRTINLSPIESASLVMDLLNALLTDKYERNVLDTGNALVLRAQQVVRDRLHEDFNATELAAYLHVSREHLARVFQEQIGRTPYQYVLREKLLLACHLLKSTELPIQEISTRTGCSSLALFSRRFRSHFHMSPSQFRRLGVAPVQ